MSFLPKGVSDTLLVLSVVCPLIRGFSMWLRGKHYWEDLFLIGCFLIPFALKMLPYLGVPFPIGILIGMVFTIPAIISVRSCDRSYIRKFIYLAIGGWIGNCVLAILLVLIDVLI